MMSRGRDGRQVGEEVLAVSGSSMTGLSSRTLDIPPGRARTMYDTWDNRHTCGQPDGGIVDN